MFKAREILESLKEPTYTVTKMQPNYEAIITKLVEALDDSNRYLCSILEDEEIAIVRRPEIKDQIEANKAAIKLAEGK